MFLSAVIKKQSRTNLKEIRDRKIPKATSSPQLTTDNTLTN